MEQELGSLTQGLAADRELRTRGRSDIAFPFEKSFDGFKKAGLHPL